MLFLFPGSPDESGYSAQRPSEPKSGSSRRPSLSDLVDAFAQTQPVLDRSQARDVEYILDWVAETFAELPLVFDTLRRLPAHTQAALLLHFADAFLSD